MAKLKFDEEYELGGGFLIPKGYHLEIFKKETVTDDGITICEPIGIIKKDETDKTA